LSASPQMPRVVELRPAGVTKVKSQRGLEWISPIAPPLTIRLWALPFFTAHGTLAASFCSSLALAASCASPWTGCRARSQLPACAAVSMTKFLKKTRSYIRARTALPPDTGKIEMRPGHEVIWLHRPLKHSATRFKRLRLITVEQPSKLGIGKLRGRDMNDIAPDACLHSHRARR
jgi:hypothetical protein